MGESRSRASQDYRQRFLDLLDSNERLEADAGRRVSELAALLARLARTLGVTGDSRLAGRLQTLADALAARPLEPALGRDLRSLMEQLLEFLDARDRDARLLADTLSGIARRLEADVTSWRGRRALARFRRRLEGAGGPPGQLAAELAALLTPALERGGGRERDEDGAAGAIADAPASAGAEGAAETRAVEPPPCAPIASPARACQPAQPRDWQATRSRLAAVLDRLVIPPDGRADAGALETLLADVGDDAALESFLEGLAPLVEHAFASLRVEFRGFLDAVDSRLDELLGALGGAQAAARAARAARTTLTGQMQDRLSALRREALGASDLDGLKRSIEGHLDQLSTGLSGLVMQDEASSQASDTQVAAMRDRLRALELESAEARRQLEVQRRLALTDALTGVANRAGFDAHLEGILAGRSERAGRPLSIAMADIDHFKRVNDEHGHQAGDRALRLVANILSTRIRATDICARFGGEEFVVLFDGADLGTAARISEDLRRFVEHCGFNHDGRCVPLTISFGVSELEDGEPTEALVARADAALYAAKRAGRNRVSTA